MSEMEYHLREAESARSVGRSQAGSGYWMRGWADATGARFGGNHGGGGGSGPGGAGAGAEAERGISLCAIAGRAAAVPGRLFRSGVFARGGALYGHTAGACGDGAGIAAGGSLWITLHPLWMLSWEAALASPKAFAFEMYRLANTGWFTVSGTVFRYPLRRSRLESYQTERGMRVALKAAGFEGVEFQHEGHFLAKARKAETKRA